MIGDKVGYKTVLNTLEISCNGFRAPKEPIEFDNISWYGPGKIAPSIRDPRKLYDRLFSKDSLRTHVSDVTDLVLADAKALSSRLSSEDRATMDEYMTMVRNVEVRMAKLEKLLANADVTVPRRKSCRVANTSAFRLT